MKSEFSTVNVYFDDYEKLKKISDLSHVPLCKVVRYALRRCLTDSDSWRLSDSGLDQFFD